MVVVFCFNFLFLFMMNLGMGDESNRKQRVSEWKMGNLETETSEIAFKGDGSLRERDRGSLVKNSSFLSCDFLAAGWVRCIVCVCFLFNCVFKKGECRTRAMSMGLKISIDDLKKGGVS